MNWKINTLEYTNDSDKGVVIAHWDCNKVDGVHTGRCYGSESFTPDPSSEDYVAYADLTEEIVLGWVYEALDKDAIEANVQGQIDAKANPVIMKGIPWT
tara:strand:+ start:224 stop:520 length:297 start_codon:yes stop_codon:yes gene_type:complete